MPRVSGIALCSAHGDLEATLHALEMGQGDPGLLNGDLATLAVECARQALAGEHPDQIILATTKGDLERWCADLRVEQPTRAGGPAWLADQIAQAFACRGFAVSGACASGPLALGVAARGILAGRWRRVVVVGADRIGAFISEGFAALKAIDPARCRPFDIQRAGLRLGETLTAVVLQPDDDQPGDFLCGWAGGMDANHLTGPTRDGSGLARVLSAALARADVQAPRLVVAHGTGTRYNDDSESLAYATVCAPTPVTAWKGMLGHSLGACGISEFALATRVRQRGRTPGCANLTTPGCAGAIRLLPPGSHPIAPGAILLANAGFGGINGSVVVAGQPSPAARPTNPTFRARIHLDGQGWRCEPTDGPARHGTWSEPVSSDQLPRLSAKCVLGHIDATWGRMDLPSRALVTLGHLLGPLPTNSAIVLVSSSGSASSDRLHDQAVRAGAVEPQRFPYTLPTTAIGEASIRLQIRGPGLSLHGVARAEARAVALDLLGDGIPGVLIAWIEADLPPHLAEAEWWST